MKYAALLAAVALSALIFPSVAAAQTPAGASLPFVLNSLFLLICGALVMFMAAGFAMLEAGSVRAKSVSAILIKNVALYAIAGLMFYLSGYNLLFGVDPGGLLGSLGIWQPGATGGSAQPYADNAFWFFQMVFVATAASVVSGSLAERIRLWPFLLFVAVLTGFIYPVTGGWTWGGGYLAALGFSDFAGSTVVHSVGGWAALAGAMLLGPRAGRFGETGAGATFPHASAPQVAIGVFILWFGWFGFNGGSRLSFSSVEDAIAVSTIFANTNAAAAGGLLATLLVTRLIRGKPDLLMTLNGALAGLVAITAEPTAPSIAMSALIGAGGGLVMLLAARMLIRYRIDDVVGAVPVHLAAGIFGTLVVPLTNSAASFFTQLIGVAAVGLFTFSASMIVWTCIRGVAGLRLKSGEEMVGADQSELGTPAYHLPLMADASTPLEARPDLELAA